MSSSIGSAFGLVTLLSLTACAATVDEETSSAPCDTNPELGAGIHAQGIQSNGARLNGEHTNTGYTNRIALNGSTLSGFVLNGAVMNRIALNGTRLGNGVDVNGVAANELVGKDGDGRMVSGDAFVGAKIPALLSDGTTIDLVVTAFERSALDKGIALYELSYEGKSICANDEKGIFVPGIWDELGAHRDAITVRETTATVSYSCASGVIAKCAFWGYAPWTVGAALHQTCTRMARADYCGTGVSYTKNGTPIDVFDAAGVQGPTNDETFLFEAGWGDNGATCVNRTRYDAHDASGEAVMPSCWQNLPKCSSFEEAKATGATIGNASRPQARRICN